MVIQTQTILEDTTRSFKETIRLLMRQDKVTKEVAKEIVVANMQTQQKEAADRRAKRACKRVGVKVKDPMYDSVYNMYRQHALGHLPMASRRKYRSIKEGDHRRQDKRLMKQMKKYHYNISDGFRNFTIMMTKAGVQTTEVMSPELVAKTSGVIGKMIQAGRKALNQA